MREVSNRRYNYSAEESYIPITGKAAVIIAAVISEGGTITIIKQYNENKSTRRWNVQTSL